jgi:TetR/AcrR family transcriptional regulator, regulator of cefoperazone and chloramphenicol sensitivity
MAVTKFNDSREAGPQRGDATRKRLIETAIEIFAVNGFDGTSTRMLAERAQANLGAIPYYFGGKAGLYRAAAQHIADGLSEKMLATVTGSGTRAERSRPRPSAFVRPVRSPDDPDLCGDRTRFGGSR